MRLNPLARKSLCLVVLVLIIPWVFAESVYKEIRRAWRNLNIGYELRRQFGHWREAWVSTWRL